MAENNFRLIALLHLDKSWRRVALDQHEFIGEGLDTLETAREAAKDAIAYINDDPLELEACEEIIIIDADGNELESAHA